MSSGLFRGLADGSVVPSSEDLVHPALERSVPANWFPCPVLPLSSGQRRSLFGSSCRPFSPTLNLRNCQKDRSNLRIREPRTMKVD